MEYESPGPEETQKIAAEIATYLIKENQGQPLVIALEGELGAGKTTFIQGFVRELGVTENVRSPTFVLIKKYELNPIIAGGYSRLYHFDCYRIKDENDLIPLGAKNILKENRTISLVEWSERVQKILPLPRIKIHIDHVSENQRKIIYEKVGFN